MNLLKMEKLVCSLREQYELQDDAEILIEGEDGVLYDFKLEYMEETFDGFYTAFPSGLKIIQEKGVEQ